MGDLTRREFISMAALGIGAALVTGCGKFKPDSELFRKKFSEMSRSDIQGVLERLEEKYSRQYNKPVTVKATPAREGVLFGFGLDVSRCIGCRRCVHACVKENNASRDTEIQWSRVVRMEKGGFDLEKGEHYYDPPNVPEDEFFYLPVQCQQCENPACVKVCPVGATWKEPDGMVVVDYDWCIGCRTCMAACPYRARKFNWKEPVIPEGEINTETHYLGNRPRMKGVVEKCTNCIQRVRQGRYPACVEACPVGARKFGNLLDPKSEIRYVIENFRVFRLKEELNTEPKFYYFFSLGS
jgi:Fe-S-cluster-containing dehydrogenase component